MVSFMAAPLYDNNFINKKFGTTIIKMGKNYISKKLIPQTFGMYCYGLHLTQLTDYVTISSDYTIYT